MLDRRAFFDAVRRELGALAQSQVDGFTLILDEAERRLTRLHELAYMLATCWLETGRTMQPVREAFYVAPHDFAKAEAWRKRHLRYYPFYGRGLVQLTWDYNYRKAGLRLGADFLAHPDLVMDPAFAVAILFDGMEEGWFTNKTLSDAIDDIDEPDDEDRREFIAARRIINGTDKAARVAGYALTFERALKAGKYSSAPPQPAAPPIDPGAPPDRPEASRPAPPGGFFDWLLRILGLA